jgi:signal transduction histidine kinase
LVAAVTNLVLNALQAGSRVRVVSKLVEPERMQVLVCDNGPGIPAGIASEVFEPFVTSKPEGMGLGLPLVRRAAEHLDGEVEWSRQGELTVFCLLAKVSNERIGP